jgi:catalase-peroxidase
VAIKQKYGQKISWADLMVLDRQRRAGVDGLQDLRLRRRPPDDWEPDLVYWGPEKKWLADERYTGDRKLARPAGRRADGPHLREPRGPQRQPDPLAAAKDIRETFGRMAMNDEETVALIAGGHTFGKAHGAPPGQVRGPEPPGAGSRSRASAGRTSAAPARAATPSPAASKGAWTANPTRGQRATSTTSSTFEWVQTKSPAGATQWVPKNGQAAAPCPTRTTRRSATRPSCSPPTSR